MIVTHSPKRARKDRKVREDRLNGLRKRLANSRQPASLAGGGNARYLDFPDGQVRISTEKVAGLAAWDGLKGIVAWGCEDHDPRDLVVQYRRLSEIEACFRTNKHDLRIRPIYHRKEHRIRSHLAIFYMAFCCLQHLCYRLRVCGHTMSTNRIQSVVNRMQVNLLHDREGGGLYGMPSKLCPDGRAICRTVGVEWNRVPFMISPEQGEREDVRYDVVS